MKKTLLSNNVSSTILDLLKKQGTLDCKQIAERANIDEGTVIMYMTRLEKLGYVRGDVQKCRKGNLEGLVRRFCLTRKA